MSQQASVIDSRPKPYRDYSEDFKANAIALVAANNGIVNRAAIEAGIDESLLRSWLRTPDRFRKLSEQKKVSLADLAESNAYSLAKSIAEHDLESATLQAKSTAFGVMVDKMQLLRGQPTSITESVERNELTVILQTCLTGALSLPDVIDVEPE